MADDEPRRLRDAWSTACSPRRTTASAGRGTGSTWPATPTRTATRTTSRAYRLEVPRLGHRRPQPRPAVRPVHHRAARRRPAARTPTAEQRSPPASTATRMINQEGGIDLEQFRFETLVDRVEHDRHGLARPTLGCAQCHDHKFDPISQKEYYQLLAFFNNGEYRVHGEGEKVVDRWIVEPELELATPEQARRREALRREAEALRAEIEARDLDAEIAALEEQPVGPAAGFARARPLARGGARAGPRHRARARRDEGRDHAGAAGARETRAASTPLRIKGGFTTRRARRRGRAGRVRPLAGGEPGEPAGPRALAGRADDNPLTARVAVNRIWEQYLRPRPRRDREDFGTQGEPPSTRAARLAGRRVHGHAAGAMKAIHRLIVTSATYRQSSRVTPELLRARSVQPAAGARPALPPRSRDGPRRGAGRQRAAEREDRRARASSRRSPTGVWDMPYNDDRVGDEPGRGPLPPRALHLLAPHRARIPACSIFDAPSRESLHRAPRRAPTRRCRR